MSVTARWQEFVVRSAPGEEPTIDRRHREIDATTDGDGVFRLCGVPGGHQIEIEWGLDGEEHSRFVEQDRRVLVVDFIRGEDS